MVVLSGLVIARAPDRLGPLGDWASRWMTPTDSDHDGLPDAVERSGWKTTSGTVRTDPARADTDGDGLEDAREADEGLDPLDTDTDDDELSDGDEVEIIGTDALAADSDADGFEDGYEHANRESRGLSPVHVDVKVSKRQYVTDFAKGAVLGDLNREDSLAWLAGNLASGGSSFLPGVGWVVGGLADVRDAVGSAIRADWVGSAFSAAGVLPSVGDTAAIPNKAAAFVARNPELAASVTAAVLSLKAVPERIKRETARRNYPNSWGTLTRAGAGEKALMKMAGRKADLNELALSLRRPGHVPAGSSSFFADGWKGEAHLESILRRDGTKVETQVIESTEDCVEVCNPFRRRFDVVAGRVAHESKVGYKLFTPSVAMQIQSDAYLIKTGRIRGAHWHFFPSAVTRMVGADRKVLELLDQSKIRYTIYLPG